MESQLKISEAGIRANLEYYQNIGSKAAVDLSKVDHESMKWGYELQLIQNEKKM